MDELAVFKLLGEHILERMPLALPPSGKPFRFDAAPLELSEALLAIAVFCCRAPPSPEAVELEAAATGGWWSPRSKRWGAKESVRGTAKALAP